MLHSRLGRLDEPALLSLLSLLLFKMLRGWSDGVILVVPSLAFFKRRRSLTKLVHVNGIILTLRIHLG